MLITHEMRLVAEHVDRVIIMSEGVVAMDGGVEDIFSNSEILQRCRLLAPPITVLAQRLKARGLITQGASTPSQLVDLMSESRGDGRD